MGSDRGRGTAAGAARSEARGAPPAAGRASRAQAAPTSYPHIVRDSVTVHIDAPAEDIWALVSDITNTGKFSPETFEAEWLGESKGPAVGARFRGHVRRNGRGPVYWTNCTVTACVPGREFAFAVDGPGGKAVNTWSYQFAPDDQGTDVTESFQLTGTPILRLSWK